VIGLVSVLFLIAIVLVLVAVVANTKSESKSLSAAISNGASIPTIAPLTGLTPTTTQVVGHVASTLTVTMQGSGVNTTNADVTLVKVIDPAQGSNDLTTPDTGKRFVGAEFQIASSGGAIDDDAEIDASLVGSDNQTYASDFDDIAGCTDFDAGAVKLAPGESSTGCVTFQVPSRVTVKAVKFGTETGTTGEWLVP